MGVTSGTSHECVQRIVVQLVAALCDARFGDELFELFAQVVLVQIVKIEVIKIESIFELFGQVVLVHIVKI